MNNVHLIIKSRTVAMQLRKTNHSAAQRLIQLVDRWEALRSAQRKLRNANERESGLTVNRPDNQGEKHVA